MGNRPPQVNDDGLGCTTVSVGTKIDVIGRDTIGESHQLVIVSMFMSEYAPEGSYCTVEEVVRQVVSVEISRQAGVYPHGNARHNLIALLIVSTRDISGKGGASSRRGRIRVSL